MNPTQVQVIDVPVQRAVEVEIESSDWFNASKKEPGQPGVYEVNALTNFDLVVSPRRFAYFNGKAFGSIADTPSMAYACRFDKSSLGHTITAFRGLVQAA